jgi:hypothetical protein
MAAAAPPPGATPLPMIDLATQEDIDGISFSWNVWPTTRIESSRTVVPIGAIYTPLKSPAPDHPPVEYQPVVCKCKAILNPFCGIDIASKTWTCQVHLSSAELTCSSVWQDNRCRLTTGIFSLDTCHWNCNLNSRRSNTS